MKRQTPSREPMQAAGRHEYGPPEVISTREVQRPTVGKKDVLVRVLAAGIDRSVWHVMTGRPHLARLAFGLRRPRRAVLGGEFAGVVAEIGAQVSGITIGQQVFGSARGTYAEYVSAPADRIARTPEGLSPAQAASLPISGCAALHAVRVAQVRTGQRVLILGAAGGVGSFAVQLAKAAGARVTGVCRTSAMDFVSSLGAAEVLDYTGAGIGTDRYDAIIDTGGNRSLGELRGALTPQGHLVVVGGEQGGGRLLGGADRQLRACLMSAFVSQHLHGLVSHQPVADLDELRRHVESGELTPRVEHTYPLAEAASALRHLTQGGVRGKVAVVLEH